MTSRSGLTFGPLVFLLSFLIASSKSCARRCTARSRAAGSESLSAWARGSLASPRWPPRDARGPRTPRSRGPAGGGGAFAAQPAAAMNAPRRTERIVSPRRAARFVMPASITSGERRCPPRPAGAVVDLDARRGEPRAKPRRPGKSRAARWRARSARSNVTRDPLARRGRAAFGRQQPEHALERYPGRAPARRGASPRGTGPASAA